MVHLVWAARVALLVLCWLGGTAHAQPASERVLVENDRHAVSARLDGEHLVVVLEALADRSDETNGAFPRVDFAQIAVDVNQNGRVDKGEDVKFGANQRRLCRQRFLADGAYSGCDDDDGASVQVAFEGTARQRRPHPVWTYRLPAASLAEAGEHTAHLAVVFHEAGKGYTGYPEGGRPTQPFAKVMRAPIAERERTARPDPGYVRKELGPPAVEMVSNERIAVTALRGRGRTTFVLEAVGDTRDDLRGRYPKQDTGTIFVDVNQDLEPSPGVDLAFGVDGRGQLCASTVSADGGVGDCGSHASRARVRVAFEGTDKQAEPHPVWSFDVPNRELTSGSVAHLVFRFHEARRGNLRFPTLPAEGATFDRVAVLDLRTLEGGVRPDESEEREEPVVVEHDTTPPNITVSAPVGSGGRVSIDAKTVRVEGHAEDGSGLMEVLVGGEDAGVSASGEFWRDVPLSIGENQIRIRVQDTEGNWAECGITVVRETAALPPAAASGGDEGRGLDELDGVEPGSGVEELTAGAYHALLIAVQDYDDPGIPDLDHPIADARRLQQVLTEQYRFEPEHVTLLENPTEGEVFTGLQALSSQVGPDDNVVVFYAGHGTWNDQIGQGYWLPRDAKNDSPAQWLSNADIRDLVRGIASHHTLLISDACFSGGLFKTRDALIGADRAVQELHRLPSRKAMTSGTLTEVPDDSVFLDYLIDRLEQAATNWVTADALFADFRQAVINNSPNTPQYGVIYEAGDEGGEFVFVRR